MYILVLVAALAGGFSAFGSAGGQMMAKLVLLAALLATGEACFGEFHTTKTVAVGKCSAIRVTTVSDGCPSPRTPAIVCVQH